MPTCKSSAVSLIQSGQAKGEGHGELHMRNNVQNAKKEQVPLCVGYALNIAAMLL